MIFVYSTFSDLTEAKNIAKILLEKKVISCANFFPCNSMYPWKGEITEEEECIMIAKTEDGLFGEVKDCIIENHSYELPVVASIPVEINEDYKTWMEEVLK